eukprot:819207-Lingulodinium_polyedra.AAC.1
MSQDVDDKDAAGAAETADDADDDAAVDDALICVPQMGPGQSIGLAGAGKDIPSTNNNMQHNT